jgi:hypothetical protein
MSALVVLVLLADAAVSLFAPQKIGEQMPATGFAIEQASTLGTLLLVSVLLYAIPKTASLGTILITAFLGGAICAHLRIGEVFSAPQVVSLLLGALTWGGLYLRDARYRALLPLRI